MINTWDVTPKKMYYPLEMNDVFWHQRHLNHVQHFAVLTKNTCFLFLKISVFNVFNFLNECENIRLIIKATHNFKNVNFSAIYKYTYFSFFSVCYCSKNYMSSLMKEVDNDCTIKCAGDNSSSCGGNPNFVSLYITDSSSKLTLYNNTVDVWLFIIVTRTNITQYSFQKMFIQITYHVKFKIENNFTTNNLDIQIEMSYRS